MSRPITKRELLDELQRRISLARSRDDWQAAEIHSAAWHRVNVESDLSTFGMARRIAARQAPIPLPERIGHEEG